MVWYIQSTEFEVNAISESILDFLVDAKRQTYSSQGDDASVSPLLIGSRQLEYRNGTFFYRDIYFGVAYFVGQETIYKVEQPIMVKKSTISPNRAFCNRQ